MISERVAACLSRAAPKANAASDTVLVTSGLIDSLTLVDLIASLETEFKVQFSSEEMIPDNFDSISAISALVARKTGANK